MMQGRIASDGLWRQGLGLGFWLGLFTGAGGLLCPRALSVWVVCTLAPELATSAVAGSTSSRLGN